jgi:hypothetical protein
MPRPSPAILSRDAVVDVAWRIIDGQGTSALSITILVDALGIDRREHAVIQPD